ncbi:MAG: hypothetical protein HQL28_06210 [Candidatus Omnitrophica bacterium]|nr:hypothetical protein [Candidatus Omnitrophota bacterium]
MKNDLNNPTLTKLRHSALTRAVAVVVSCLFLWNDVAYSLDARNTTLAPVSTFKPAVSVTYDPVKKKFDINEDPANLSGIEKNKKEDAAFLYLNLAIGQFLHTLDKLSAAGMSREGLELRLKEFKRDLHRKFSGKRSKKYPRLDLSRLLYKKMRLENMTVCLPYARKDDGRMQVLRYYLPEKSEKGKKVQTFPDIVGMPVGNGAYVILEDPFASGATKGRKFSADTAKPNLVRGPGFGKWSGMMSAELRHKQLVEHYAGELLEWAAAPDTERAKLKVRPLWNEDVATLGEGGVTFTPEVYVHIMGPIQIALAQDFVPEYKRLYGLLEKICFEAGLVKAGIEDMTIKEKLTSIHSLRLDDKAARDVKNANLDRLEEEIKRTPDRAFINAAEEFTYAFIEMREELNAYVQTNIRKIKHPVEPNPLIFDMLAYLVEISFPDRVKRKIRINKEIIKYLSWLTYEISEKTEEHIISNCRMYAEQGFDKEFGIYQHFGVRLAEIYLSSLALERTKTGKTVAETCRDIAAAFEKEGVLKEFEELTHGAVNEGKNARFTPPAGEHLVMLERRGARIEPGFRTDTHLTSPLYEDFLRQKESMKEAVIVPLYERPSEIKVIKKTADWEALPMELKEYYERGIVLVTAPSGTTLKKSRYSVLMYKGPVVRYSGRVGVVLCDGAPVTAEFAGKSFMLEAKGIGVEDEGYPSAHGRVSGFVAITGAYACYKCAEEYDAMERDRLSDKRFSEGNLPRVCGEIDFNVPEIPAILGSTQISSADRDKAAKEFNGQLAILLRWTPSSKRAAFELKKHNVFMLGRESARELPNMHLYPHPENILVWGEKDEFSCFIDRGHIAPVLEEYDNDDVHVLDVIDMEESSFKERFEAYVFTANFGLYVRAGVFASEEECFAEFKKGFIEGLADKGVSRTIIEGLNATASPEKFLNYLWDNYFSLVAYKYYKEKGYFERDLERTGIPTIHGLNELYRARRAAELEGETGLVASIDKDAEFILKGRGDIMQAIPSLPGFVKSRGEERTLPLLRYLGERSDLGKKEQRVQLEVLPSSEFTVHSSEFRAQSSKFRDRIKDFVFARHNFIVRVLVSVLKRLMTWGTREIIIEADDASGTYKSSRGLFMGQEYKVLELKGMAGTKSGVSNKQMDQMKRLYEKYFNSGGSAGTDVSTGLMQNMTILLLCKLDNGVTGDVVGSLMFNTKENILEWITVDKNVIENHRGMGGVHILLRYLDNVVLKGRANKTFGATYIGLFEEEPIEEGWRVGTSEDCLRYLGVKSAARFVQIEDKVQSAGLSGPGAAKSGEGLAREKGIKIKSLQTVKDGLQKRFGVLSLGFLLIFTALNCRGAGSDEVDWFVSEKSVMMAEGLHYALIVMKLVFWTCIGVTGGLIAYTVKRFWDQAEDYSCSVRIREIASLFKAELAAEEAMRAARTHIPMNSFLRRMGYDNRSTRFTAWLLKRTFKTLRTFYYAWQEHKEAKKELNRHRAAIRKSHRQLQNSRGNTITSGRLSSVSCLVLNTRTNSSRVLRRLVTNFKLGNQSLMYPIVD